MGEFNSFKNRLIPYLESTGFLLNRLTEKSTRS